MRKFSKILLFGCLAFPVGSSHGQTIWPQQTSEPVATAEPGATTDPLATEENPPTECLPSPDPDPLPDPYCPLDSGLVFLLIAGAAYGVKKYSVGRRQETITADPLR